MSLVELLVAAAIGIIASLAIFQVFAVFEAQKRTTTSGGEAQISGTLAVFALEREIRQAGYGINNLEFLGCQIQGYDSLSATPFTLDMVPVRITQGAAGAPDTITVMYGSGELLPNPASITQNMPSASSIFKVSNRYGFQEGDIIIAAETGKNCTLAQVSSLPGALGLNDNLIHDPGTYTDPETGFPKDIRYNPSPPPGITYTTNAKIFNLGAAPVNNIYSIQSGQLTQQQALFAAVPPAATPLYDGIVQLQAQYGKDNGAGGTVANDGIVDFWEDVTPATTAQWAQVLAVRFAVVTRSGLYEKEQVSPATIRLWEDCIPSPPAPPPGCSAPPYSIAPVWTLTVDERHYRYKVFHAVVPIRNMIWKP
jgi:type IV pilus assembly protein PilW